MSTLPTLLTGMSHFTVSKGSFILDAAPHIAMIHTGFGVKELNAPVNAYSKFDTLQQTNGQSDWIEQGLTSHQTHYRSYRGRVLWVK